MGELRARGYVVLAVFATAVAFWRLPAGFWKAVSERTRRRVRRLSAPPYSAFVGVYTALVAIAFVGGALYAPNNYDALTYRVPRVLHWLFARGWSWVATSNPRMNYSGTGAEWMTAPVLAVSHSDRLLFLFNAVPYLLIPGLVFAVFRRLGVANRVSWFWMWILPSAYCFAMQAGGISNDTYASVFLLAAMYLAFRAVERNAVADAWLSMIAAALLTGVKASNAPLLLPCLVALWPARRLLASRMIATAAVFAFALSLSFIPTAFLNWRHTGHWSGDPDNREKLQLFDPVAGIVGNSVQFAAQALQPPVLPGARRFSDGMTRLIPSGIAARVRDGFPRFSPTVGELPQEEAAGLGIGVTTLVAISLIAGAIALSKRRTRDRLADRAAAVAESAPSGSRIVSPMATPVIVATWIAVAVFACKMGSEATARLLAPYYPLLIASCLRGPANAALTRSSAWRATALVAAGSAIIGGLLSPSRPIWPAETTISHLLESRPTSSQLLRAREVYAVYARRHDLLAPVAARIPRTAEGIGLVAGPDDAEIALWNPCCNRHVEHLVDRSSIADAQAQFEWVVGTTTALSARYGTLDSWLAESGRVLVAIEPIKAKASSPPKQWFVARRATRPRASQ